MKAKKIIALLTAVLLGTAGAAGSTQAATFHSVEQTSLDELTKYIRETPQSEPASGSVTELTVQLEDAGRAIAGMMVPLDLSWVDHADIVLKADSGEDVANAVMTASLNDVALLTLYLQMDLTTMDARMQIPELSPALLQFHLTDTMETSTSVQAGSLESEDVPLTEEQQKDLIRAAQNLKKNPPSQEVIATLVERYVNIIYDAYEEGEAGTDTISVEGHTVNAETVEGILKQDSVLPMTKELLTTARDDADLKAVLEQAMVGTSGEATAYENFQSGIDALLEDLENEGTTEETAAGEEAEASEETAAEEAVPPEDIVIKLWVDEQQKVIGTALGAGAQPVMQMLYPSGEDWSALDLTINAEEMPVRVAGSGTIADGTLSGSYILSAAGQDMVNIAATQSADTKETHVFDGEYVLTPITDPADETNPMNSIAGFGLAAGVHSEKGDSSLKLDLQSQGASLINAALHSMDSSEPVAVAFPEDADVYSMTDDSGMDSYLATMDPTSLMTGLTQAGMPEDFFEQIDAMNSGDAYGDDAYTDDADAGDAYAEETTGAELP